MAHAAPAEAGIVIPLRSFTLGKARLADALDADARATLARTMAERVVAASRDYPVVVVSSAPEVVTWARDLELATRTDPGSLNGAATLGQRWAHEQGLARYAIVHADLPHITTVDHILVDGREL